MKHTCPCCGHRVHSEPIMGGSMQICPICFWEDVPGEHPDDRSNGVSLLDAQENYRKEGACDPEFINVVRAPNSDEEPDSTWRSFRDDAHATIELIEHAFGSVALGNGMTIHQREVISDYGTQHDFDAARRLDTERRWQDIAGPKIGQLGTTLIFLDPESIRYHLPAFMRHVIRSWLETSDFDDEMVLYSLSDGPCSDGYHADSFTLLNPEQKQATATFLQFIASVDSIYGPEAGEGLTNGWDKWLSTSTPPTSRFP
ncbi:CPCC family cysteine-rich protein [Luteolibacter sp. SL250]|uniref:DUF6714 family protein n=1 Tax=Luteolibacter sp. SL250 TaxID=2995170 RepID=UPI00227127B5|nr:DUF6714 family protein [Luteolibacter sp. SL250]WAC20104.1 CPCC family cysteine-rich protein [Luteolibacter sp. SL250]